MARAYGIEPLTEALIAAGPLLGSTGAEVVDALGPLAGTVTLVGDPPATASARLTPPDVPAGDPGYETRLEAFTAATAYLEERFGWTLGERAGPGALIAWPVAEPRRGGFVQRLVRRRRFALSVELSGQSVDLVVRSLAEARRRLPDGLDSRGPDARPAQAAGPDADGPAWRDHDWTDFAATLALELADLTSDEFVILTHAADQATLVQAIQYVGVGARCLHAEAINNYDGVPERELPADGRRTLADLGWERSRDGTMWEYDLAWPARFADYRRVAGMLVGALRDAFGVRSPADLVLDGSAAELPRLRAATRKR